jgi:4-amino-4-deoxy-L-arabinose transferase-like glycosyltransferase
MFARILLGLAIATATGVLYFYGLADSGLLGPDEPRYADIGRAMWQSGDWITPRLFKEAWFEKPALLYWLVATGFALGANDNLAPRLLIPLLGCGFLAFFFLRLRVECGHRVAVASTVILATSAGWLGFNHAAVTDLPLTVFFSAGMLLALPWALRGERRLLPWATACFAIASLAKGLVPLVLAAPLVFFGWRRLLDFLRPKPIASFVTLGLPWYLLCYLANGQAFIDEFFWEHHVGRFFSEALQHVQPFWFYVPVLVGLLLPWTPVVLALATRQLRKDADFWRNRHLHFFAAWLGFGFLFFSASTNKLPGYLLPLTPAAAALLGIIISPLRRCGGPLSAVALLSALIALAGAVLPEALSSGLSRATIDHIPWALALPSILMAVLVYWQEQLHRRAVSLALIAGTIVLNIGIMKWHAIPQIRETASAVAQWERLEPSASDTCIGRVHRAMEYGLRYYSHGRITLCADVPRPLQLNEDRNRVPRLEATPAE